MNGLENVRSGCGEPAGGCCSDSGGSGLSKEMAVDSGCTVEAEPTELSKRQNWRRCRVRVKETKCLMSFPMSDDLSDVNN